MLLFLLPIKATHILKLTEIPLELRAFNNRDAQVFARDVNPVANIKKSTVHQLSWISNRSLFIARAIDNYNHGHPF